MGRFQNPADYIIKLGQAPHLCKPGLDLSQMSACYEKHLRGQIFTEMKEREEKYNALDTNFQEFAENRASGQIQQFIQVYIRNVKFLLRNK